MLMMPCVNGLQLLGFSEFVFGRFFSGRNSRWWQLTYFLEKFSPRKLGKISIFSEEFLKILGKFMVH